MLRFFASRALLALLAFWLINSIVFFLARTTGDASTLLIPLDATPEQAQAIRQGLGLDRPLVVQYGQFLGGLVQGDLGVSYRNREPVSTLISQRAGASFRLTLFALVVSIVLGVPAGMLAALKKDRWPDHLVLAVAFIGQAMPSFFLALLLVQYVAANVSWLPSGRDEGWASVILPGLTLAAFLVASVIRLLRGSMIEALQSDYVRMARLKGLSEFSVVARHALKNALLPVLSLTGMHAALSITVAAAIEVVFAWPGLGQMSFDAIVNRDLAVLQGIVVLASAVTIAISLFVDWLSAVIDPRLRLPAPAA